MVLMDMGTNTMLCMCSSNRNMKDFHLEKKEHQGEFLIPQALVKGKSKKANCPWCQCLSDHETHYGLRARTWNWKSQGTDFRSCCVINYLCDLGQITKSFWVFLCSSFKWGLDYLGSRFLWTKDWWFCLRGSQPWLYIRNPSYREILKPKPHSWLIKSRDLGVGIYRLKIEETAPQVMLMGNGGWELCFMIEISESLMTRRDYAGRTHGLSFLRSP